MWCIIIHWCNIIVLFTSRVHIFAMCRERSRGDWIWLHLHAGQEEWTKRDNFKLQLRGRQPSWTEFYTNLILLPCNHDWYKGILHCFSCTKTPSWKQTLSDIICWHHDVNISSACSAFTICMHVHECAYMCIHVVLHMHCRGTCIVRDKDNVYPGFGQIISGVIRGVIGVLFSRWDFFSIIVIILSE